MKELHNQLFSKTACISKEAMLKSINKQLSKKELYTIEKHLLDCELCTDAYTGLRHAQNSSVLFTIDNAIDKKVGVRNSKVSTVRNLMVATSVLALLFVAYYSVNSFNEVIDAGQNLAVNERHEVEVKKVLLEESIEEGNSIITSVDTPFKSEVPEPNIEKVVVSTEKGNNSSVESVIEIVEENVELVNAEEVIEDFETEEREVVPLTVALVEESSLLEMNSVAVSNRSIVIEDSEKDKKPVLKTGDGARIIGDGDVPQVPVMDLASNKAVKFKEEKKDHLLVIEGYKVVDYRKEYQEQYNMDLAKPYQTKSVSAGFESEEDMGIAKKELEAAVVKITYQEVLENAIRLYKNKK
jgi:hypothetical protein